MLISQTPLRISFAGGGTDMAEFCEKEPGMVISAAIDKYVYIIINERYDDQIVLNYSRKERVEALDRIEHDRARESMRLAGVTKGVEITCVADIPSEGSGLGSSSAFTVGLLNALYQHKGEQAARDRLAAEACHIEIDKCHSPIGRQDQYAAAYGGINVFTFGPGGKVGADAVRLPVESLRRLESRLLLFYTNTTRKSESILAGQKANISGGAIRDVMSQMRSRVAPFKEALVSGDCGKAGPLLAEQWEMKKTLAANITNDAIDLMYRKAVDAGAMGGKLSGAGGGGFLLLCAEPDRQDAVRRALKDYREMPFRVETNGSRIIFNMRANPWVR